jgi:hypothetical protein
MSIGVIGLWKIVLGNVEDHGLRFLLTEEFRGQSGISKKKNKKNGQHDQAADDRADDHEEVKERWHLWVLSIREASRLGCFSGSVGFLPSLLLRRNGGSSGPWIGPRFRSRIHCVLYS